MAIEYISMYAMEFNLKEAGFNILSDNFDELLTKAKLTRFYFYGPNQLKWNLNKTNHIGNKVVLYTRSKFQDEFDSYCLVLNETVKSLTDKLSKLIKLKEFW